MFRYLALYPNRFRSDGWLEVQSDDSEAVRDCRQEAIRIGVNGRGVYSTSAADTDLLMSVACLFEEIGRGSARAFQVRAPTL